eukprot:301349-Amphidinium_carterae.2
MGTLHPPHPFIVSFPVHTSRPSSLVFKERVVHGCLAGGVLGDSQATSSKFAGSALRLRERETESEKESTAQRPNAREHRCARLVIVVVVVVVVVVVAVVVVVVVVGLQSCSCWFTVLKQLHIGFFIARHWTPCGHAQHIALLRQVSQCGTQEVKMHLGTAARLSRWTHRKKMEAPLLLRAIIRVELACLSRTVLKREMQVNTVRC